MLNTIVKWSIAQRWLIVIASLLISIWGWRVLGQMPLDVFPSFAPPQVEIQADAPGLAPEEVESLVTRPIESAINGTPGLESLQISIALVNSSPKGSSGYKVFYPKVSDNQRFYPLVRPWDGLLSMPFRVTIWWKSGGWWIGIFATDC